MVFINKKLKQRAIAVFNTFFAVDLVVPAVKKRLFLRYPDCSALAVEPVGLRHTPEVF